MARVNAPSRLTLKMQTGYDNEKGLPIIKSYSFSNVVATANDAALFSVAHTLAGLSSFPLYAIVRTDIANLED